MKEHALAVFRQPPDRLNCAQAVLHAYQQISKDMRLSVADLKACGGGRAPGGLCGALYAACAVAPDNADELTSQFAKRMGSVLCKELVSEGKEGCNVCVANAAELLDGCVGKQPL